MWYLDGLRAEDLPGIARWRNAQRMILRSRGFTHPAIQDTWLQEMRAAGSQVAAIRESGNHDTRAYVALHPLHGDYAELGWLIDEESAGVPDAECIRLGVELALECGLHYLIAEPTAPERDLALRAAGFTGSGLLVLTL